MADNKKVVEEEDDFTFGTKDLKTGKGSPSETEVIEEEKEEKEEKEDKDEKEEKDEKDESETSEDDYNEDTSDEKKGDEKKSKKVEEEDLFAEKTEEEKKEGRKRTLKEIGKKFDLDLTADDDDDEFETKLSDKLSKSRQEVNLDGFSDDAKALIKHLNENEGDVESFFTNQNIIGLQSVLSLDAETKVRNVRLNELVGAGSTKADALATIEEEFKEMSTREIKDLAGDIDDQAKKLIQTEVKKMVGDKELKAAANRQQQEQRVIQDRTKLKGYVEKQEAFLGLKLSSEAKKTILRDIDNGEFDKLLNTNPEEQKFAAYMLGKHGAKILKKIDSTISEQNRKGFNAATKKSIDALHNIDDNLGSKKSGHQPAKKVQTGNRPRYNSEDIE
jgi:hypothetical protein